MQDLKKRLSSLYAQKESIEREIQTLEAQLAQPKTFSKFEKIELFKSLFVARDDLFLKKWVSKDGLKNGFFPATATFKGEDFLPLTNHEIEQHLRGAIFLATYTISKMNLCSFVVFQITPNSKEHFFQRLASLHISGYLEVNSNADYYVWVFFEGAVLSKEAKAFAQYILKYANVSAKIFPNQEFVNQSSRGDFVELPLHLENRNVNKTVFIDPLTNEVVKDQWAYLSQVQKLKKSRLLELIAKDVVKSFDENVLERIQFPAFKLSLIVYDFIYIPVLNLSASLINKLKSMASFDNPQVKTLLALRKPLYNIPRVLRNYEEDETYLKLPRGLLYEVKALFDTNNVLYTLEDKRHSTMEIFGEVKYTLREEQNDAIKAIVKTDFSICVAPPGFGKTLIGAKMVQLRASNALVVVNKNMLLDQWRDRFVDYFGMSKKEIGFLGKGKNKLNNRLDVATMQSLKNAPEIIQNYSFVIVDECHHIPAVTFEQIIKGFSGKFILGLSATPNRKDGLQPILFQQLGPVSYEFKKKRTITHKLNVIKTDFISEADNYAQLINDLCENQDRNTLILEQIKLYPERKILVLTDRIEHINHLEALLKQNSIEYVSIHGSLNKKLQNENMQKVQTSNLILATTSFFGEGIDFPHLNTIIFATPISYYGRLVQYLGRVGRDGQMCLAIDILDSKNAMLNSAYKKRLEGYKQMHYK